VETEVGGQLRLEDRRSDAELLRAADKDPEAFRDFYRRHVTGVIAFLYRRTACPETAADLMAETFAKAFLSRHRFKDDRAARPWLLGIARHELSRAMRRRSVDDRARRRLGVPRVEMDEVSYDRIEELADFAPIREAIREALGSLPSGLAQAVRLRVGLELGYPQVALRLGCSEGAARVRVARGLARLAEVLEAR
jgi:RNA polymerase sigma factor (sigma-70 family)